MIDLSPQDLEEVRSILSVPERDVYAFGSRVGGNAWRYSDLDLVIMGEQPRDLLLRANLREAFEESPLPFRVDIVEWATTEESFRRLIERQRVLIHRGCPVRPTATQ